MLSENALEIVRAYSAGQIGTRDAIEAAGFRDYGDLIVALAQNDLEFPKPSSTPAREANIARATAILQPLLRLEAAASPRGFKGP